MAACLEAIDVARDPEKVAAMLSAFYGRGIAGDNAAGKIWLERVLGPVQEVGFIFTAEEMRDAPDEVVAWIVDRHATGKGPSEGSPLPALEPRAGDDGGLE